MDRINESMGWLREKGEDPLSGLEILFRVDTGASFGTQREYETRLHVSGDGSASLFRRRDGGDSATEPPGWFSGQIPSDRLLRLLSELEAGPFEGLEGSPASPGDAELSIELLLGGRLHVWNWSSAAMEGTDRLDGVMALLYGWGGGLCTKAISSLELEFKVATARTDRIDGTLVLRNAGEQDLRILRPGGPGMAGPSGIQLLYGVAPIREEGVTPLPFEPIHRSVSGLGHDRKSMIVVPAKGEWSLELKIDLESPLPSRWMGQLGLYSYGGEDRVAGVEVFGGAVFSHEFGS